MADKKNLQCSRTGSYYIYFDKSVIEKAFNWQPMQPVEIKYDAQNKRIVITEAEVKPWIPEQWKSSWMQGAYYRSDPQVFEAAINKLRQGNRVIAAAAEMLLEKARGDVECLL